MRSELIHRGAPVGGHVTVVGTAGRKTQNSLSNSCNAGKRGRESHSWSQKGQGRGVGVGGVWDGEEKGRRGAPRC